MTTAQNLASWARKAREATARRDELIGQMRAEGAPLRTIAAACDLSHTAVAKVLARAVGSGEPTSQNSDS